jgi:hypothetical protein
MPVVGLGFLRPGNGERLTGATPGPHGALFGPFGEFKGAGPAANTGEEVANVVLLNFFRIEFPYVRFINKTFRYFTRQN